MIIKTATEKEVEIVLVPDHDATGEAVARLIEKEIKKADRLSICFATGSSPLPTYRRLVNLHETEGLSFENVRAFLLDEYLGLPPEDPNSFRRFMEDNLFAKVNLPPAKIHSLDGMTRNPEETCREYDEEIRKAQGIDLVILGIGQNGHIAFNEPGTPAQSRTRVVNLTKRTRLANARFFPSVADVPEKALSVGIANILETRFAILIATGEAKRDAVTKTLLRSVTEEVPASFLQNHPGKLVFVLDEAAAAGLPLP